MPFRMPFAGEGEFFSPDSVLSHCYGALLPMFDTAEATVLCQLCREFKDTVGDFPWEDEETVILGSVAAWRTCFPRARWANVNGWSRKTPMVEADFVHFEGLRRLDMSFCKSVTDAAFVHLKGIHTLNMAYCYQSTITDTAFTHLKSIHTLDLSSCDQPTITDAAFVHLKGIHSLSLWGCSQLSSQVFTHLKGIKRLNIGECDHLIPSEALKGIEWLNMCYQDQVHIDEASKILGIEPLEVENFVGFYEF